MDEQKRVKLTHGTARVDKNCSKETLSALDELSKLAYEQTNKPLNIARVTNRYLFYYEDEGVKGFTFEIDVNLREDAINKAYEIYGPQVEGMMYRPV